VTPLLHPHLINGRTGDPALFVETLFDRRAILFDLGDITALSSRNVNRIELVFISHTHIDHFFGFDRLLRLLVGRERTVCVFGPTGLIEAVHHKLHGYQWNLVDRYLQDLKIVVTDVGTDLMTQTREFRLKTGFAGEDLGSKPAAGGIIYSDDRFVVSTAVLEHRVPCLAFAIEERGHVNVWKNRLDELGLGTGKWLQELKRAVTIGKPPETLLSTSKGQMRLSELRDAVRVTKGQKIAYVTDAADTQANRARIIALAQGADLLFIEAPFMAGDRALADDRAHLTTETAGTLAAVAGARRVEPFHFSSRYEGEEDKLLAEVQLAFHRGHPSKP
jgi:ribonuclease Z